MPRKSNYTLMNERINAKRLERSQVTTRLLGLFNPKDIARGGYLGLYDESPEDYPLVATLANTGTDRVHVRKALKNLESKGNDAARQLLNSEYNGAQLNITFGDLLSEFRMEAMELEDIGYLELKERKNGSIAIVSDDDDIESLVFYRLYARVTKYLYEHKTAHDRVHASYEVETDDGKVVLINVMDRKGLAQYVDKQAILESAEFKRFIKSVKKDSRKDAVNTRLSIIDGLLDGLTYKAIAERFQVNINSIGSHVRALREIYKETFMDKLTKARKLKEAEAENRMDTEFSVPVSHKKRVYEHFPQLEFDGVYYDYSNKTHKLSIGGARNRVSYDIFSDNELLAKVKVRETAVAVETSKVSKIKPSKKKFESAEFLYKCRHKHCLNPRSAVLTEETKIREALKLENKRLPEVGELKFLENKGKIEVYYGDTLKSVYNIVRKS